MPSELINLLEYKEFLRQYTAQHLKTRYRGSVLGFFWTLLNPLLTCLVLSIVFSYINKWNLRNAGLYFFAGYIPWTFFSVTTNTATNIIPANSSYVTRIYVPRIIFPISTVLVNLIDLLAGVAVILVYMAAIGAEFTPAMAIIPLAIVLTWIFVLGVALLCATVNVFLRDFQYLWASLTFLWFFFTPILYPLSAIPESARHYFEANPVLPFVVLFQQPMCYGTIPPAATFGTAAMLAVLTLACGLTAFLRSERMFYLYL